MYRTHNCGELNILDINKKVILSGWVHNIRILKKYIFIDLRDYYGITKLFIKKKYYLFKINNEYLIRIKGIVKKKNKNNIEVHVYKINIINKSKILPFNINSNGIPKVSKKLRLKYRYLDIRRKVIKDNLIKRSNIINKIRQYFLKKKFIELETPLLVNNTIEGARNFIIPSRNFKGKFYSLPQSPQIFKQLLMIGGIDKYFQIAKCFRDEDLRKDRQTEFLQLDIEISFINKIKNIIKLIEKFIKYIFKKFYNQRIIRFKKIKYNKAIKKYNTDKPNLINKIYNINIKIKKIKKKYNILSFILPNFLNIKNFKINKIIKIINIIFKKKYKKILIINNKNKYNNNFKKKKILNIIKKKFFSEYDILIIIIYNNNLKINKNKIFDKINKLLYNEAIYKKNILIPIWIINFPLFKYNIKNKKYYSYHHPFTCPIINNNKLSYKNYSKSYDLVINGIEIASGSIRINNYKLQKKIFNLLKIKKENINKNFKFFLNALKYGVPPHGGIGIGIDRLILLLLNKKDIKNLIPFPKNYYNKDIMLNSPSKINNNYLFKLGIKIIKKNKIYK
ncbi:MAG: hypothetical protein RDO_1060 [Flavobacteriales endosymbiont of Rhyzopertha dominica]|nr:MAG: aspartate--tRNA ligase [Candidatus Shikimatogenerans bostrichidophilus]